MLEQAQAELPNECCGLLAGRVEGGVGRVEMRYPLVNETASPIEYNAEPRSMLAAFKDMRARGIVELAIYHSHPTSVPIPSKTDRERNYSAEVMNLIIGLGGLEPVVRGWWLTETDFVEASWETIE
jgi:[CysO sulfur-carrier protein]-S-L-cysteine hydrolase